MTVKNKQGVVVAKLSTDFGDDGGKWLILSTNMDNEHRRMDAFPYSHGLEQALTALLTQLQAAVLATGAD